MPPLPMPMTGALIGLVGPFWYDAILCPGPPRKALRDGGDAEAERATAWGPTRDGSPG